MADQQIKIEEKISESSSTAVYRAFDEVLERKVLLKVLHKHLANDQDLRSRFVREARACAALRSEHIVQVYDLTEIDEAPAIVMEFVEGKSLKEGIVEGVYTGFDFAKKAAVQVLRGLSTAHKQGVIHRDIKPGNILVSNDGTIKVTDFGLAYVALSPTVTIEGMVLGTPAYMAPEQILGEEVDVRTDLFSLGATLIEILTGERIFEGSTYTECMKKVLSFKDPDLDKYAEYSSAEFVQFLRKLMHPKREERFSSANEALSALGEKKSSLFLHPAERHSTGKRMIVPVIIATVTLVLLLVFGWITVNQKWSSDRLSVGPVARDSTKFQDTVRQAFNPSTVKSTRTDLASISREVQGNKNTAQDSGKILLTSNPWAKVYVNGQLIGETPMAKQVTLAAGTHTVMFNNPFFDPIIKTVDVEPNKEITIVGNFLETVGYLQCTVVPWADVYVDEQYKDTTPLSKPIMLPAGKHLVRFKNNAFADVVKEITVAVQDTVQLSIELEK